MNDDAKLATLGLLALVLMVCGGTYGAITCNRQDNHAFEACVQSGKAPAECSIAIRGRQ